MSHKREFRPWKSEVRMVAADGKEKIVGYAAVFNQLSEPLRIGNRSFRERVLPTAFDRCLGSNPDIRGLVNHDSSMVLGRTISGTMTVSKDEHGLRYEIDPPATSYANDLRESMRRGDIDASSFGFYTTEDNWTTDEDGNAIRELVAIDCFDVSPVAYPAYPGSSSGVEMRSLFPDGAPDGFETETEVVPENRADAKTKKVDGKDLTASDFAHVGDPNDTSTWKLPIHDAGHVRNALARFNQVQGLSDDDKKAAWRKILAAAKKFGIHVSEQNSSKLLATASYRDARALVRMIDPDGDGDDDEPLIDALIDAREGCSTVAGTASGALWTFFDGDDAYSNPMLEAFVKQANALIADLQAAIVEVGKELAEPTDGERSAEKAPQTTLQMIARMAELERD